MASHLSFAGLEFSFHRLGREAWLRVHCCVVGPMRPGRRCPSGIALACLSHEVVWLGIGQTGASAELMMIALDGRSSRRLRVPPDWQLAWLLDADGRPVPLRPDEAARSRYRLEVRRDSAVAPQALEVHVLAPSALLASLAAVELASAQEPPPVQRYSHIVKLDR